jgi:hypothetical protein
MKQATIMDKILVEEKRLKKRKKQQPHLWTDPKSDKSKVESGSRLGRFDY